MFFVAKICKRALRASIEGYLAVSASTPFSATLTDMQRLWLPLVIYENTDSKESTRLGETWEWATNVFVKRNGNPSFASYWNDWLHATQTFKGTENDLQMSQTYTHEFQCVYQLSNYPFDTQVSNNEHVFKLLSLG